VTIAMQVLEKSVVVVYQSYLPLCWVNIKRAIVLLVTNKTQALSFTTECRWRIYSPRIKACKKNSFHKGDIY
jgi:hypothetical protein